MTNVTSEIHRVRREQLLILWYVWYKPYTYLASRLALSPHKLKWASTSASSPTSTTTCVQNDCWAHRTFDANRAPILRKASTIYKWIETSIYLSLVTEEYHRVRPKWFLSLWHVWHKHCTYLALTPTTISKWIETWFHMANVTQVFYRVCPKLFLSLWYVRRKPRTYLASRLALSTNRPKQASTSGSSPRSTIRCVQNDFNA
jgi:hypothetical protein